jgi:protein-S-isoprenylcysteine O-methyltransferase Ste14
VYTLFDARLFLDYAHWHLLPALDSAAVKTVGLILYLLTVAWLFRVDRFLFRHFVSALEDGVPMTDGPYCRVRHPRYAGLFFSRLALAPMLGSPIAWCLCILWWLLIERRIRREERYLQARFGSAYDLYAAKTPRLIPAVRLHR